MELCDIMNSTERVQADHGFEVSCNVRCVRLLRCALYLLTKNTTDLAAASRTWL